MITITNSDLKSAIAGLAKVVSNKSTLECLRCIRVDATPERTSLLGTDLDMFARVRLPGAQTDTTASFLLPLDRLQSLVRRLPPRSLIYLEEGKVSFDLGTGRVSENVEAPELGEFSQEPDFRAEPVELPESFSKRFLEAMACASTDPTRYILNGALLEVSGPKDAGHYIVGTDGRHLFSANSFTLPFSESVIVPSHKILSWRGLNGPWALATQKGEELTLVRIVAGDWTLTTKAVEGTYPNWRQVIPRSEDQRTEVTLPDEHEFSKIVNGLPGSDLNDKPVDLVVQKGVVAVKDSMGGTPIPLVGAKAAGPDLTIRLNRDYLTKALDYGLTKVGLIDAMSPLHFTKEGRQMVVMPLRVADVRPATEPPTTDQEPKEAPPNPAPSEPQPERTMTETNSQTTSGEQRPHTNGADRSKKPVAPADKPAIEAAIDKLDAFKATFREALTSINELTALLRQAVRDQKAGEKEVQQVRQTLRSLQSVKL
jgi:DNA polymerase III sliding clamp (beta) subunit (PCNA family)